MVGNKAGYRKRNLLARQSGQGDASGDIAEANCRHGKHHESWRMLPV